MRILTAVDYYAPHWTGLTVYAQRIAEGLVERGHQVTVLCARHDPALARRETLNGVDVVRLATLGRLSRAMVTPGFPAALARFAGRHDIVHVHSPSSVAMLAAGMARLRGKPVIVTHQGDVVMPPGVLNRVVQGTMRLNLGTAARLASAITTHSADYAQHSRFLAPYLSSVTAIYPPTLIPPPDAEAAARWRTSLGAVDAPLVGFAGRFVEEKGFDVLLRAIPLVRERLCGTRFVFAGETNVAYERFFERWRTVFEAEPDALRSVGLLLDRQQLANFYAMCDLFVLPSRTDCFAAVQVEALLCGTPLVTSDIPGAREVVNVSGMGRLAAANDPVALADAIVAALHARTPRPERDAVVALFDAPRDLDRYERLFRDVLARRPTQAIGACDTSPAPSDRRLTAADMATLDEVLRNEADTAYRRRVPTLMGYLRLVADDVVLDCGCGMGYLSMVMGELGGPTIVGLDGDVDRLRWAQREGVPALPTLADVGRLPFSDGAFDKVLLSEVLEHLGDDLAGLKEIRRVLKPGGVVAMSVPHANYPFLWDPINKLREGVGASPMRDGPITGQWSNHQRLYLPEELRRLAEAAGFELLEMEEQTHHVVPFHHVLVYTIGKPLIEHGLLPTPLHRAADRFSSRRNPGSLWNPVNLGVAALRVVDRRNDRRPVGPHRSYVSLVACLRRPTGQAG